MLGAPLLLLSLAMAAAQPHEVVPPAFKPAAPAAPEGCREGLKSDGVRFSPWPLRPSHLSAEILCEAPEGVAIKRGGAGLLFQPQARVNCASRNGWSASRPSFRKRRAAS